MLIIIALSIVGGTAIIFVNRRRSIAKAELQRLFLQNLIANELPLERYLSQVTLFSSRRSKLIAAESLAQLSSLLCRIDKGSLLQLSESLQLGRFLISEAKRGGCYRSAYYLSLLSSVPSLLSAEELQPFAKSECRMVRFFAMLCSINLDREGVESYLAAYRNKLNRFEISHLVERVRRGDIVVDYRALLRSASLNLNLLAVAIVVSFGIDSAEDELLATIALSPYASARSEALYAMVSLSMEIRHPFVVYHLNRLEEDERDELLRFISLEGYSDEVISYLVRGEALSECRAFANSYKVKIEC